MENKTRIAIIGAGALTQQVYIPILKSMNDVFEVSHFCDSNILLLQKAQQDFPNAITTQDYTSILFSDTDAVLIVLPNFLHAMVSQHFLKLKIPVLVEKPMANTVEECNEMIHAHQQFNTTLCVGYVRRFFPLTDYIQYCIRENVYGQLKSIDLEEGFVFDWKIQSDYLLKKEKSGGGVMMDTAVHSLDQIIYWLGYPDHLNYNDDYQGGVESTAELKLQYKVTEVFAKYSRIKPLKNSYIFTFEKAIITAQHIANTTLHIKFNNNIQSTINLLHDNEVVNTKKAFQLQLLDFRDSILNNHNSKINGESCALTTQLINQCYASR
jgi:predicted dehydrogenase